jgi:predicted enzyme related to lactoylglutathione lyase
MSKRIELVLDCGDAERLAEFWAAALGYRRFGAAGTYISMVPDPDDGRPKLLLQGVPEAKTGKNRMHLDVIASDIEAEATRLVGLGAQREPGGLVEEHGGRWLRMADPEGNEFCVCQE